MFGAALGLVVGGGFGVAFVLALRDDGVGQLVVPFDSGIAIAVVAVIAGVVASLGPARHAGRVDILKAVSAE